ncbi:MAG: hypothetical protein FWH32_00635 [Clostridiales bacterium]|nr:hypothetical protein [Clostridiales bacterium]
MSAIFPHFLTAAYSEKGWETAREQGTYLGEEIVDSQCEAIEEETPALSLTIGETIALAAEETLGSVNASGQSLGKALMYGAGQGVMGNARYFSNAAAAAARAALSAMKREMGINSPSKEGAYIGANFIGSIAAAALEATPNLARSISLAGHAMTDALAGQGASFGFDGLMRGEGADPIQGFISDRTADRIADRMAKRMSGTITDGLSRINVIMDKHEFDRLVIGALKP